jgi:hypothetical protein
MATSSFEKIFVLKTKKEVQSFLRERKSQNEIIIDKNLASQLKLEQGVKALKKILSP